MGAIWSRAGAVAQVRDGTAQVWRWMPNDADGLLARAHAVLSKDERERAARTRAGPPRDEFMAARGALRLLLGAATGAAPETLQFSTGEHGKPALVGNDLNFNVSHARGCVLVALSRAGAVGVDVEPLDRDVEALELAQDNFHPAETAYVEHAAEDARLAAFYRCWTRKEAVVKADGRGLQLPLSQFCVLGLTYPVQVQVQDGRTLWVQDLELGTAFAGALALPKREAAVTFHDLACSQPGMP